MLSKDSDQAGDLIHLTHRGTQMFGFKKKTAPQMSDAMVDAMVEQLKAEMFPPMLHGFTMKFEGELDRMGVTDPELRTELMQSAVVGFEKGVARSIREQIVADLVH
jgi:hypothetical protein